MATMNKARRRETHMKSRMLASTLLVMLLLLVPAVDGYTDSVSSPERTQGLVAPAPQGDHQLVALKGPGKFVSAQITKQGGTNDLTFVSLDIDGKNVVSMSIAAAKNWGLTADNPYGVVLLQSAAGIETLTVGFNSPLEFRSELKLRVKVQEPGVAQIVANVIHGK
jgi:hypothetical protein